MRRAALSFHTMLFLTAFGAVRALLASAVVIARIWRSCLLLRLVCDNLTRCDLWWVRHQGSFMLLHELSCLKGRLLLSVLMLKDANCNHYAVAGVDPVVSHESRHFADDGHKALLSQLRQLLRVTHTLVSAHCNVHSFSLPPFKRGRDRSAPPKVDQHLQCEGLEGPTQLPRIPLPRTPVNRGRGEPPSARGPHFQGCS